MRRRRLTRTEEHQYLAYATIMQQEGISLEIPKEWKEHAYPLEIAVAPPPDNEVFERSRGGLSYSVYVRLLSKARCMIEQVEITVAWDDCITLERLDQRYPVGLYGYPPVSWKEVLNSRIEAGLKFARSGGVVEGFLLFRSGARFPEAYRSGQVVPFTLRLYDQYGVEMQEHGYLCVQRAEGKVKTRARVEDLFGNRNDPGITKPASTIVQTSNGETKRSTNLPLHLAGRFKEAKERK